MGDLGNVEKIAELLLFREEKYFRAENVILLFLEGNKIKKVKLVT